LSAIEGVAKQITERTDQASRLLRILSRQA
jgi:hypothetical protein